MHWDTKTYRFNLLEPTVEIKYTAVYILAYINEPMKSLTVQKGQAKQSVCIY